MKLTGLFKRGAACLCTAAILMGGVSAFAPVSYTHLQPTRRTPISYAVFCLKKKKKHQTNTR